MKRLISDYRDFRKASGPTALAGLSERHQSSLGFENKEALNRGRLRWRPLFM